MEAVQQKLLVTVGTTHFDELIDFVVENLYLFAHYKLTMQIGSYSKDLSFYSINTFDYTSDMERFYTESDYIITHGGSGTILNALRHNKPVLVIANTRLLGNHQLELIEKLRTLNLIHTCTLDNFKLKTSKLSKRPKKQPTFTRFIHGLLEE